MENEKQILEELKNLILDISDLLNSPENQTTLDVINDRLEGMELDNLDESFDTFKTQALIEVNNRLDEIKD